MNTEKIKELLTNKQNRVKLFVCVGLIGMVVIMLSETLSFPQKQKADTKATASDGMASVSEYKRTLEEQLSKVVGNIAGAGKCSVMITFETGSENVYAYNSSGSKDEKSDEFKYEYLVIDGDDGEQAVLVKRVEPQIKGVVVVCEGGDDKGVKEKIIGCVTALFDISTNRVSVNKMAQ